MTVLVAGATGTTGSAVVRHLRAAGVPVRAMSRSADKAAALTGPGVEGVTAAYDDPESLARVFAGVSAAYVVSASTPDIASTEGSFARAAAAAGAHLVKLSVIGASTDATVRFAVGHAESEAAIEGVGGTWTFLQPNGFMQNDLVWAAQIPSGTVAGPVMDAPWSIVDVEDVAAVAVAALTSPGSFVGQRLPVTGPEARTPRDRIAALSATLGRELAVVDVPIDAVKEQLMGYGLSQWYADGLGELFALYATGQAAAVAPDTERVLGRPGRRWEDFTAAHTADFSG